MTWYACAFPCAPNAAHCSQCGALVRWREWGVQQELGAGGMGTAYLVTKGGTVGVLKRFHAHTTGKERMIEIRTLYQGAALGVTPVPLETSGDGVLMEYLAPTATVPRSERILTLLRHLTILHNRGFVVVDVKPENVIVTGGGTMLIDLGSMVDHLRDIPDDLAATPGYAAPELYRGAVAPIADAYGAGWCVVAFLGGPVPDPSPLGPPRTWAPPPAWGEIVAGLLHPHPAERMSAGMAYHRLVRDRQIEADLVTVADWQQVLPDAPSTTAHGGYAVTLNATDVQRYLRATGTRLPSRAEMRQIARGTERQGAVRDWGRATQAGLIRDSGARNTRRYLWQPTSDGVVFGGTASVDSETMPDPGVGNRMIGLRVVVSFPTAPGGAWREWRVSCVRWRIRGGRRDDSLGAWWFLQAGRSRCMVRWPFRPQRRPRRAGRAPRSVAVHGRPVGRRGHRAAPAADEALGGRIDLGNVIRGGHGG